jgi:hypothetical protein
MVYNRKSLKRTSRKKNLRGGDDDEVVDQDIFMKRVNSVALNIKNIDNLDNDEVKDIFLEDVSEIFKISQNKLRFKKWDSTDNSSLTGDWAFLVRCVYNADWDKRVKIMESIQDDPKQLYKEMSSLKEISTEEEPANGKEQVLAKYFYKMLSYMEKMGWTLDVDEPDNDWADQTIYALKKASTDYYLDEDYDQYDILCYCCRYYDEYKEFVDSLIKKDEDGEFNFKEGVIEMQKGGNRRRRISRRRYY